VAIRPNSATHGKHTNRNIQCNEQTDIQNYNQTQVEEIKQVA